MFEEELYVELDENEQSKEVYAIFGLAIYTFQVVEHQLINMLLGYFKMKKIEMTTEEYDDVFSAYSDKTMGKLISAVIEKYKLGEPIKSHLWKLHKIRNYYCHHYFKDHSIHWYHLEKRIEMIKEFDATKEFASDLDNELTIVFMKELEKIGVKQEDIDNQLLKINNGETIDDTLIFKRENA